MQVQGRNAHVSNAVLRNTPVPERGLAGADYGDGEHSVTRIGVTRDATSYGFGVP